MLRRLMHNSAVTRSRNVPTGRHVWSDFTNRSHSLAIRSPTLRKSLMQSDKVKYGPASLRKLTSKLQYSSPIGINEAFALSCDYLEGKAGEIYKKLEDSPDNSKNLLLVEAEINNPQVQFNFQFNDKIDNNPSVIDYKQPVYRHLGKIHWQSRDQMLLMQRLETLKAIPDTLPTLDPRADVRIKFPFSTGVNKWIEPGEFLSSNATSMEPIFKIQEFEDVDTDNQLYTILIVNPDEPDLANDSFKTSLCYGLYDLKVSYNDNIIDSRKFTDSNVLLDYIPPVPEKNAGKQRYIVWVFRQPMINGNDNQGESMPTQFDKSTINRDDFDIRKFVELNKLDPIGAHIWRSEWDLNVSNVRKQYALPEGRVFSRVRR